MENGTAQTSRQERCNKVLKGISQGGVDISNVKLEAHRSPRFEITSQRDEMLAYLDEYGYAVVKEARRIISRIRAHVDSLQGGKCGGNGSR